MGDEVVGVGRAAEFAAVEAVAETLCGGTVDESADGGVRWVNAEVCEPTAVMRSAV